MKRGFKKDYPVKLRRWLILRSRDLTGFTALNLCIVYLVKHVFNRCYPLNSVDRESRETRFNGVKRLAVKVTDI